MNIVNISELSTYMSVYNGVASVMNEKHPEDVDYYVSYNSKVYAGFDFSEVDYDIDTGAKKIYIKMPEVGITDVSVDIASLEFIFENDKANTSSVTQEAYSACKADAEQESKKQQAIIELAEENAERVLRALVSPILEQLDEEYELIVS